MYKKQTDLEKKSQETPLHNEQKSIRSRGSSKTGEKLAQTHLKETPGIQLAQHQQNQTATAHQTATTQAAPSKKGPKTRITIKYDVGFSNAIYLRGKGANLSWDKGILLKNVKNDEWVWETETPFSACEFKALINDQYYEHGENHPLQCGTSIQYTPRF